MKVFVTEAEHHHIAILTDIAEMSNDNTYLVNFLEDCSNRRGGSFDRSKLGTDEVVELEVIQPINNMHIELKIAEEGMFDD